MLSETQVAAGLVVQAVVEVSVLQMLGEAVSLVVRVPTVEGEELAVLENGAYTAPVRPQQTHLPRLQRQPASPVP